MPDEKRKLPAWKSALFAAIPTALALLALNFVLGKLHPRGGPARSIYTDHPYRWTQLKAGVKTDLPVGPEADHWKKIGATYHVEINSHGFRGPERPLEKGERLFRIVALGDSATFGWDNEDEDTFARTLERRLNEGQPERRFEVINAGVPGYTTPQGRLYLEQDILALKPDFLTISYGTNDEALCKNHWSVLFRYMPESKIYRRDADGKALPVDKFFAQPGLEGTATYRFIADLARRIKAETGIEMDLSVFTENKDCRAVPVEEYEENLYRMGLEAAKGGAETLFLTVATGDESYVSAMDAAARACGSEMIDLRKILASALPRIFTDELLADDRIKEERLFGREFLQRAQKLYYTTDYGHPNRIGHRIIAEEIALSSALGDVVRRHFERIGEPENFAWFLLTRARLFLGRGRMREAEENAIDAVRIAPREARAKAVSLLVTAAKARAGGVYADALDTVEKSIDAMSLPDARREHALILEALERWRDAAEEWGEWGKAAGSPLEAAFRRARALGYDASNRGELDEAASQWAKALEVDPAASDLAVDLARADLEREKPEEAVAVLARAILSDPEAYLLHRVLAEALEAGGAKARALAEWRWAADAAPEEAQQSEAAARVKALEPENPEFGHDSGYAYMMAVDPAIAGDGPEAPKRSTLLLTEDGRPLAEAHAGHDRIRRTGRGLYSHYEGSIFFSTSDNTDPNLNGRKYAFRADGAAK